MAYNFKRQNQDIINLNVNSSDVSGLSTTETKDMTATFSMATSRTNIISSEKLGIIFGKIMKFFNDLKTVAFTGSYNDLDDKPTIPTIPTSLPANGGNSDTVDNLHASQFIRSDASDTTSGDLTFQKDNPKIWFKDTVDINQNAYFEYSASDTELPQAGACLMLKQGGTAEVDLSVDRDVFAGGQKLIKNNDTRLTNSRTPSGTAGGDLSGTYPNPTYRKIVLVGADTSADNGKYYKITSQTFKSYQTSRLTFFVYDTYSYSNYGTLQICVRFEPTRTYLTDFFWINRYNIALDSVGVIVNGNTWELYTKVNGVNNRRCFELISHSSIRTKDFASTLIFNTTNEPLDYVPVFTNMPVDIPSVSATKLQTARTINGVAFDGTQNITVPTSTITWIEN